MNSKQRQLRKHKFFATGLFLLMLLIYGVITVWQKKQPHIWEGYVKAFAEAGMVGALADWFAVTALFRHPLGLPIPHTNLIEKRKNSLGKNLGKFIVDNFITPQNIRPYIEELDVAKIFLDWMKKPRNQNLLVEELSHLAQKILEDLNDEEAQRYLAQKSTQFLSKIDLTKLGISGLQYLINQKEEIHLLEILLPQLKKYIRENDQLILDRLSKNRPLMALLAGRRISKEITHGFISFIEEIEEDQQHFVRRQLTQTVREFMEELPQNKKWQHKINRVKQEIITSPYLDEYIKSAYNYLKDQIIIQSKNRNSVFRKYLQKKAPELTQNLNEDQPLRQKINGWARHFLYRMILKNRREIEDLISKTVAKWPAKALSNKLELEVGKDLQFIRVNGTIVGGLMGLLIYTLTQLFF